MSNFETITQIRQGLCVLRVAYKNMYITLNILYPKVLLW